MRKKLLLAILSLLLIWGVTSEANAQGTQVSLEVKKVDDKPGYIPFIGRVGNSVYIQNEAISGDLDIIAGTAYIGKDVTNERPEGSVEIDSGKTSIKYINDVIIKNDFEVKNGATLEIIPIN